MEKQEPLKRNALGDIEFGKIDFDWSKFRHSHYTYSFHYYDPELGYCKPYFDLLKFY